MGFRDEMNTLIFGASGYVGGHLASSLKKNGHHVTGFYRNEPDSSNTSLDIFDKVFTGDIQDTNLLGQVLANDFDSIIYCISLNHHDSQTDIHHAMDVNVNPIIQVLERIKGKNQKFIYFSTMQVYGKYKKGDIINEEYPINPVNNYGLTHLLCENILNLYKNTSSINACSLRLSNSYGPPVYKSNDCWWLVVNDLCQSAIKNKNIVLQSDGHPERDFINLDDLSLEVENLLTNPHSLPAVKNICSGKTYSIGSLAKIVSKIAQKKLKMDIPVLKKDGKAFNMDEFDLEDEAILNTSFVSKYDSLLQKMTLEDGISKMLDSLIRGE